MGNRIEPIFMPKWGMSMKAGLLLSWLVEEGEGIEVGQEIAEIETEKLNYDLEATAGGLFHPVAPEGAVVAVDEAQFFDEAITKVCTILANKGIRVIVAGLDQDFRGDPFGPMPIILSLAEQVSKLHAICVVCGKDASRTQRMIDGRPAYFEEPTVVVGGSESYEARCRIHHDVPHKPI